MVTAMEAGRRRWPVTAAAAAHAALVLAALATGSAAQVDRLGAYWVSGDITTSGVSSGAAMAVQLHVAYSGTVGGVGAMAGNVYYCAQGKIAEALGSCVSNPECVDLPAILQATNDFAATGQIDSPQNLAGDPVYIFHGTEDDTVDPGQSLVIEEFYRRYNPTGRYHTEYSLVAAHTHPTDNYGNDCLVSRTPFISNCGYDLAGVLLQHLSGNDTLKPRSAAVSLNLLPFDQREFNGVSMDDVAFVYVPAACQTRAVACSLHIAFHGCLQSRSFVGNEFAAHAGFNEWAEANNIIVLYPQAASDVLLGNPNACWDWWGYGGRDYAVKAGRQLSAVYAMVARLSSGAPVLAPPTGLRVTNVTDSSVALDWSAAAGADGYTVYRDGNMVTIFPVTAPSYVDTALSSGTVYTYTIVAVTATGAVSPPSTPVAAMTSGTAPPIGTPTGLVATQVSDRSVAIQWSTVAGAVTYVVARDGVVVGNTTLPSFTSGGLSPETAYSFVVRAVDASGVTGAPSAPLVVTTAKAWVCQTYRDNNVAHVYADRAYHQTGIAYALGSNDYMGVWNVFFSSTLAHTGPDYYIVGECP